MNPYKRISTLHAQPEVVPVPKHEENYPLQDYLDENMMKPGVSWWAQPGAPMFPGEKSDNELFNEWVRAQKDPWRYSR